MILNKLNIVNYKNIAEASLSFSAGINCLTGANGAGKTNVLDAIYMLSFCKSLQGGTDQLCVRHDADFMVDQGEYLTDTGDALQITCSMKRGQRKHFKHDSKEYQRLAEHIGKVPLIVLSPADNLLILGGGDMRRRLMDVVIAQYDNTYTTALIRYNKALQQRNALLKQEAEPDAALMEVLEEEMAAQGELIYKYRSNFTEKLQPVFNHYYSSIADSGEVAGMNYVSHCQRGPLLQVIQRDRMRDRAVGYSLHGVHRDDLEFTLNGYAVRHEGSQGQTKTFVLALKLAQYDFLRQALHGKKPLLLLDDIFDKLDAYRVEQIVGMVSGQNFGQIFITDTNRNHLDTILHSLPDTSYKLFNVAEGQITESQR